MHQDLHDAVAALLRRRPQESVRVLKTYDGRRVLQCCEPPTVVQLELSGRPDGLRIAGCDSTLSALTHRCRREAGTPPRISPQDWMELDREYTQFHQRRRAALLAGAQADLRGDRPLAEVLYRRAVDDAEHCLAVIEFAWNRHPMGRLSAATPAARPSVLVQRITAGALLRLLDKDAGGAVQHVTEGMAEVISACTHDHNGTPPTDLIVRDLEALKAHLCAATVQTPGHAPLQPPLARPPHEPVPACSQSIAL